MNRTNWIRTSVVLILFATFFEILTIHSYTRLSATFDEPQHLVDGYTAWKLRDYRIDPEHPPGLRMWATLPLLVTPGIKLDTRSPYWIQGDQWLFSHKFLFQDNDADQLLMRARFMISLLGVLLGILVFCWARELVGFWPAVIVLGLYCTEPNVMAHSGLVTTDLGAACFIFGSVYFAWRTARNFSVGNVVGLTLFFTLAQVSKYSALLLVPILLAFFLVRALVATPWPCSLGHLKLLTLRSRKTWFAFGCVGWLVIVSYVAMWAAYSFRYAPTQAKVEQSRFVMGDEAQRRLPCFTSFMQWVDDHHLLPNACAQGFISMTEKTQERHAYLLGEFSERGWWYYFPLAFLIKTPLALLLMALVGLVLCVARWKDDWLDSLFVVGPPAAYFVVAMAGHLNIGLRHILPVYPFALLLAGWTIMALLPSSTICAGVYWRSIVLAGLCLVQVAEFAAIYPDCLAFFNGSVGGARHGAEYLVDSNLDWGQGLKLLKVWMTDHQVHRINLSYFGTADPAYYGIDYNPLPGAPFFDHPRISKPELPGYIAVSATNLRGLYLSDFARGLYAPLQKRQPVAILGHCIYVYWIDEPWW
ncbi:MAG TPA: glycosyltransferase family 39 protein [Verrucomicrobiae bacterium]|nr:glycosyltransferase family 39 protein [Verrucomicrobiae bacterium]